MGRICSRATTSQGYPVASFIRLRRQKSDEYSLPCCSDTHIVQWTVVSRLKHPFPIKPEIACEILFAKYITE